MLDNEKKKAGYIKLWRCLCEDEIWIDMPYSRGKLWLWLLMEAAHKANAKWRHLEPGQLNHSLRFMCQALSWEHPETHKPITPSQNTILKDLKALERAGNITRSVRPRVIAVITICNWESYQENEEGGNSGDNSSDNSKLKNVQEIKTEEEMRARVRATHRTNPALESNPNVTVSGNNFTPDASFSPNALLSLWRKSGLPLPYSISILDQEKALRHLHHDPPHWPVKRIRQAVDKLIQDFKGPRELSWAWNRGPAYLTAQKPGEMQGIEKVLNWQNRPSSKPASTWDDEAYQEKIHHAEKDDLYAYRRKNNGR